MLSFKQTVDDRFLILFLLILAGWILWQNTEIRKQQFQQDQTVLMQHSVTSTAQSIAHFIKETERHVVVFAQQHAEILNTWVHGHLIRSYITIF